MNSRSVILVGISLGILLILSCITLNATVYYRDLALTPSIGMDVETEIVLRDRTS